MPFNHPNYTLVKELGRGGSATVHLAVQNNLNRRVALKVLHSSVLNDPALGQRFLREGRLVAKLNHPHIVPIFDIGEQADGDGYYMAMEYLPAGSLANQKHLTVAQALRTLRQIATALAHAHAQNIVHRDVKPDNILFRNAEEALLVDFGIARSTQSLTNMTVTGAMLGTPAYMSPEQVSGDAVDARCDLYSLGIVMYELLTGHCPFQGDSIMSTGLQHLTAEPPPLPAATKAFQPLVDRLLAKAPADRCASANEFLELLSDAESSWTADRDKLLSGLHAHDAPATATVSGTLTKVSTQQRPSSWLAWAATALLALAVSTAYWTFQSDGKPTEVSTPAPLNELQLLTEQAQDAYRKNHWFGDNPEDPSAYVLWQRILERQPNHEEATERLESMIEATLQRGHNAIAEGKLEQAKTVRNLMQAYWAEDDRVATLAQRLELASAAAADAQRMEDRNLAVTALLGRAGDAISRGRWVLPPDDNALTYYRAALQRDADNVLATAGLAAVADYLLNEADSATAAGDFAAARAQIASARDVRPGYARIATSEARLATAEQQQVASAMRLAAQQQLDADINSITTKVNAWLDDEAASISDYPGLSEDLAALVARAPDRSGLRILAGSMERHAQRLRDVAANASSASEEAGQADDEEGDTDWTGTITF